jgi:hypothetical protein
MCDESSHRLTFPDGHSFAQAVPLSSETELRNGSPTQQGDRASPSAVPEGSDTTTQLVVMVAQLTDFLRVRETTL